MGRRPKASQSLLHVQTDITWISWETLNELLLACHDHCLMCGKSVQEQRSCTLRKAIDEGLNNDIEDKGDRCRYFGNL